MKRALAVVPLLLAVLPTASSGADSSPEGSARELQIEAAEGGPQGPLSVAAKRAIEHGPLPADEVALERAKARAAARAGVARAPSASRTPRPTTLIGANGLMDDSRTPSDSTGAIGTQRYVETVNSKVGIYDRSLNLIAEDTLQNWWNQPGSNSFQPQVIWDPTTNRFYYAGVSLFSSTDQRLSFGFSKTASPNNATSNWCNYHVPYGENFPDSPKLGDSKFFQIIGVNVFSGSGTFGGSEILAIGKPPPGRTCPAPSAFESGSETDLMVGASTHISPVPANEIDTNKNGWVLTRPAAVPATTLGIFKVSRNATTGDPVIQNPGDRISVTSYTVPADAPQKDSNLLLDTSDARLSQAVAGIDPSRGGNLHVWTQHAIAGGAGAKERWYEINPVSRTVTRTGNVQHSSLYVFNGAVSPDRLVRGAIKAFGQNMILGFSTSSATTHPAIQMVGKRGNDAVSSFKIVKSSAGENEDFGCSFSSVCRWGDYSAATPDPKASTTATTGAVYLSNMWSAGVFPTNETSWRTWNWKARP